jgi:multidrug transporter EmrE-like cation transporter
MSKTMVNVILLVISIGLAVTGQIAMKAGMNRMTNNGEKPLEFREFAHPWTLIKRLVNDGPWAIGGIILYAISALFWLVVLSRVALSVAYPIVAVGYVVVVLYSYFFFHEPVKAIAWVGLGFIVIGVAITAQGLSSKKSTESVKPATHVVSEASPNGGSAVEK